MAMANQRSEKQSREVPLQKLGKLDDPANAQQITTTATSYFICLTFLGTHISFFYRTSQGKVLLKCEGPATKKPLTTQQRVFAPFLLMVRSSHCLSGFVGHFKPLLVFLFSLVAELSFLLRFSLMK